MVYIWCIYMYKGYNMVYSVYNWYNILVFTYRGEMTVVPSGSQNFPSHSHIWWRFTARLSWVI